jgi:hypothetical protein
MLLLMRGDAAMKYSNKITFFLGTLSCLCALAINSYATVWYVDPDHGDDSGAGTERDPYLTLQHTVNSASYGDTIRLLDDVDFDDTPISIYTKITIEGYDNGSPNPVDMEDSDYRYFVIPNSYGDLTLRRLNFKSTSCELNGGAIYNAGALDLEDCTFQNCDSEESGGAIYSLQSLGIRNCVFDGCSADGKGGAVYVGAGNAHCTEVDFIDCESKFDAGGAVFAGGGVFTNCTFQANRADSNGGGICLNGDSLYVYGCTFDGNDFRNSGDGEGAAIYYRETIFERVEIADSVFQNNDDGQSTCYIPSSSQKLIVKRCRFMNEGTDSCLKIYPASTLGGDFE